MDQRLPYEETISSKLQGLPIPDLADAIWARVERQLDIDLPTDDGGSSPGPATGPGAGTIGWGLSIFIVALIAIFLLSKKDQKVKALSPVTSTPQLQLPQNISSPQRQQNTGSAKQVQPVTDGKSQPPSITVDSSSGPAIGSALPAVLDSALAKPEPLVAAPPAQDTVKKKKGVSGLSDGDYRIVPKKDNR